MWRITISFTILISSGFAWYTPDDIVFEPKINAVDSVEIPKASDSKCAKPGEFLPDPDSPCSYLVCVYGPIKDADSYSSPPLVPRSMPCAPGTAVPDDYQSHYHSGSNPCIKVDNEQCSGTTMTTGYGSKTKAITYNEMTQMVSMLNDQVQHRIKYGRERGYGLAMGEGQQVSSEEPVVMMVVRQPQDSVTYGRTSTLSEDIQQLKMLSDEMMRELEKLTMKSGSTAQMKTKGSKIMQSIATYKTRAKPSSTKMMSRRRSSKVVVPMSQPMYGGSSARDSIMAQMSNDDIRDIWEQVKTALGEMRSYTEVEDGTPDMQSTYGGGRAAEMADKGTAHSGYMQKQMTANIQKTESMPVKVIYVLPK